MDFVSLFELGSKALNLTTQFVDNFKNAKATLTTDEQSKLDQLLKVIHEKNMQLSSNIDSAAAEAEKRT